MVGVMLLLAAAVLGAGWQITGWQQARLFEDHARSRFHETGVRIAELRSVMQSMLGMHYASDEFAGADIEAFAQQLRVYSPFVRGLGMFEFVSGGMRENYEAFMGNRLERTFSIHDYDARGAIRRSGERARYLPLISIDSADRASRALLGTDMASDPDLRRLLDQNIATGDAFVVPMPANWPLAGDTLLIQPAYFGDRVPDSPTARRDQFAGGIWLSIKIDGILDVKLNQFSRLHLTLDVQSEEQKATLVDQTLTRELKPALPVGYDDLLASRSWTLGSSELSLTQSAVPRMPLTQLLVTLLLLIVSLTIAALAFAFAAHRRLAQEDRLRSLTAINQEREKAEQTLESISDSVISLDAERRIIYMNSAARRFLAIDVEPGTRPVLDSVLQIEPATPESTFAGLQSALDALAPGARVEHDVSLDVDHLTGATITLTLTRMADDRGVTDRSILVLRDVSQERKLTHELEHRANRDFLTGCFNRFYFDKRLAELVEDVRISARQHALCYIDLDQFKIVNDTCGHASGDRLLCEVSEQLRARLRSGDVLARLGGDEFGVIICDVPPAKALELANRLFEYFQNYVFEQDGKAFSVRASIGFVEIGRDSSTLDDIMSAADIACYTAKDGGRNALVVYSDDDASMTERKEEMNWLPLLKSALQSDRFRLLVQPVAAIDDHVTQPCVVHYEFLIRLLGGDDELISPFQFIRAAERYDLMREIDRWVIDRCLSRVRAVQHRLDDECTFSINLSGQSAADPDLLDWIASRFEHHRVAPSRFWFEITETAAITHFATALTLIAGIQAFGARVALDDFGSGLSSFGYLRKMPVDVLKIDGQFVQDIDTSDVAREMVRAIDHVGKAMGVKTVAEFVESQAVVEQLRDIGVDYAQGYFIGRPCTLEQALDDREDADHYRLAS